ncbi:MAG: hypothetical protein SPL21_04355 [Fibrobacter sp.]|nr:hypothetical protein [Fibrobacter sp.]
MKNGVNAGGVGIWLDEIVPCLKDTETGEIKETVVFKIESRSFLKKFKEKDGWGIDWTEIPSDVEVYALALKENNEIQGLVGVKNDTNAQAAYLHWACGFIHGFALNKELLNHYIEVIGASFLGALHPYHFMLDKGAAQKLLEVYTYEWN